jgi:predicted Zn-dependent peptidase
MSVALAENSATTTSAHLRDIRTTTLANGLLVLTERMSHLRSVAMGVWIDSGSRDEAPEVNGISHFIEHMVFKGTTTRSASQFAREVDAIGGNLDAFTGKETICFNIKVLDENVPAALDLLTDLVLHPTFDPSDLAKEQGVILEEIKMDEDNPDYLVHELFTQNFWKGDALGRPILGTAKTVSSFNQAIVLEEYARRFTPANMVFTAAGNIDHDAFVAQVEAAFASLSASSNSRLVRTPPPTAYPHITLKNKKSLEQVQFCLAVPSLPVADPDRYAAYLLNSILGGGMSSRLFQSIREERGLAYSIYSEMNPFRDTGS